MMRKEQQKIPCVYMRGGTSKAVMFHAADLPEDRTRWGDLFLKAMGSPDPKQIDGMGGTASSTSKVAVIEPSKREGIDVDYTFCQVSVLQAQTDFGVNCGNISSAVGPFAIDEGLVAVKEPFTRVRIYNTNTEKVLEEWVPVENGKAKVKGDTQIAGVPGTGAGIRIYFENPAGSRTGCLFPTGNRRDVFEVDALGQVEVTIVDCSHPVVFVSASALGLKGTELTEIEKDSIRMEQIEQLRGLGAQAIGFVEKWQDARTFTPAAPDVVLVSTPQDYTDLNGRRVSAEEMDLCVRAVTMGMAHKAYPVTDTVATGVAAMLPGTIPSSLSRQMNGNQVRLGHASGVIEAEVDLQDETVHRVGVLRTARRIMDGFVYVN